MKVIGAGFGRTGTLSIKAALEELGFGRCYHAGEVGKNPAHAKVWAAATLGKPVDWGKLFEGYQATVDWPACTHYKELMEAYPDAKVLLSVRDPARWYESVYETIYNMYKMKHVVNKDAFVPLNASLRVSDPATQVPGRVRYSPLWDGTFSGRFEDREFAIGVFNRHNEEVKRHVPPERLLVYEVKDGWEPLCEFLGVGLPEGKSFPRLNESVGFWDLPVPKRAREEFEQHQESRATAEGRPEAAVPTSAPAPEGFLSEPHRVAKAHFHLKRMRNKAKSVVGVQGTSRGSVLAAAREKRRRKA